MIVNKKELVDFVSKYNFPRLIGCITIRKGYVCLIKPVPTICNEEIMCNFEDVKEVKEIIEKVREI